MPEYLAPGVYVEEVDTGSKPIEGVSTTTSGMVGITEWGPLNIPTLVTGFADFQRQFGGYLNYRQYQENWYLPHAVEGFFQNGGKRVYIVRVLPDTATVAETAIPLASTVSLTLGSWTLTAEGSAGSNTLTLNNTDDLSVGQWIQVGGTVPEYVYVTEIDSPTVTLNRPLRETHADASTVGEVSAIIVQAIDPGAWGNGLQITTAPNSLTVTRADAAAGNTVTLRSIVGLEIGSIIEVNYTEAAAGQVYKITAINSTTRTVTLSSAVSAAIALNAPVRSREFSLRVDLVQINPLTLRSRTIASETHRNLSADPRHSRYFVKIIGAIRTADTPIEADGRTDGESNLIRVVDGLTTSNQEIALRFDPGINSFSLSGGNDDEGNIVDDTYIGQDNVNPQDRSGLFALKNIAEISIASIPGRTSINVQSALITHCELMKYRFAVLDSQQGDRIAEVQEQRGLYDTKYAALYYPWLRIPDPFPDNPQLRGTVLIPPSGHIIGIYARSDIERGVHKAPANEVIRNISDLEFKLMKEEQDILNPRNINVLRNFRDDNRGLRVWGARTLSSDPDWKYVNVRRLFIFIERSIDVGTQWVVFEPNDEPLWQRVKRVVTAFLTNVWRDGALMGRTAEEAFFVKCDRTTMTQADIDNGRLIILVGIAPVKPAEFVIFRIGQWTGGASVEEG
ncbi:phage tail sheath C-terminal domain-containing protein [Floridanema aerugineum]|uniref:Phage tail sheath C-terminal domain-containing protein n=1 Tax=Floridaenema aerugineum BLCC-F46 TaxID=3153654 RepID=A0ABV4XFL5_9CYAN